MPSLRASRRRSPGRGGCRGCGARARTLWTGRGSARWWRIWRYRRSPSSTPSRSWAGRTARETPLAGPSPLRCTIGPCWTGLWPARGSRRRTRWCHIRPMSSRRAWCSTPAPSPTASSRAPTSPGALVSARRGQQHQRRRGRVAPSRLGRRALGRRCTRPWCGKSRSEWARAPSTTDWFSTRACASAATGAAAWRQRVAHNRTCSRSR